MQPRSRQPYQCVCPTGGGADIGDLETHVIMDGEHLPGDHAPADPAHWTDAMRDAIEVRQRKAEAREALAQAAGLTMEELREAIRGW